MGLWAAHTEEGGGSRIWPLVQILSLGSGGPDSAACSLLLISVVPLRAAPCWLLHVTGEGGRDFSPPGSAGSTSKPHTGYGAGVSTCLFQPRIRIASSVPSVFLPEA